MIRGLAPARACFANLTPASSKADPIFTKLALHSDINVDNTPMLELVQEKGYMMTEGFFMNPAHDLSTIHPVAYILLRAILGRDPFTRPVISRMRSYSWEDGKAFIRIIAAEDNDFVRELRIFSNKDGETLPPEAVEGFEALMGFGQIIRFSWKMQSDS